MKDSIRLVKQHGRWLLLDIKGEQYGEGHSVQLTDPWRLEAMSDAEFLHYRQRVKKLKRLVGSNARLTDTKTIKAFKFLLHSVGDEKNRRRDAAQEACAA